MKKSILILSTIFFVFNVIVLRAQNITCTLPDTNIINTLLSNPTNYTNEVGNACGVAIRNPNIPNYVGWPDFMPNANTVTKELRVNLIIVQDGNGGGNFQETEPLDMEFLSDIEDTANFILRNIGLPNSLCSLENSLACYDSSLFIGDSKLQFKFNRIFIRSDSLYDNTYRCPKKKLSTGLAIGSEPGPNFYLNPILNDILADTTIPKAINAFVTQGDSALNSLDTFGCVNGNPSWPVWVAQWPRGLYPILNLQEPLSSHNTDLYSGYKFSLECDALKDTALWDSAVRPYYVSFMARGLIHEIGHNFDLKHCTCSNHIMNPGGSREYLTPNNIARIHEALANNTHSTSTVENPSPPNNLDNPALPQMYIQIDADRNWDHRTKVYQDIVIKSGNTLTVGCELIMPEDGSIIIEKGAKLIVDGAVIKTESDGFWDGIKVWGDNSLDQSSDLNQGVLEIRNGSLLDRARNAVSVLRDGHYDKSGGIVRISDSEFRNCNRVGVFLSYPFSNTGYFKRCSFTKTPKYLQLDTNGSAPQITLWDNHGLRIEGCDFRDLTGYNQFDLFDDKGIFSIDATYSVISDCNMAVPTSPCNPTSVTRGSFENYNYGVHATSSGGIYPITVDNIDFKNNAIGVSLANANNSRITANDFQYGQTYRVGSPSSLYGLHIDESDGFIVEANTFKGVNGSAPSVTGVYVDASGPTSNRIFKNEFANNSIGQHFNGWNRNFANNFIGLEFICNTNPISNDEDVYISYDPFSVFGPSLDGIRVNQGTSTPSISAGNLFSTSAVSNITNGSFIPFNYHYYGSAQFPAIHTAALVNPVQVNTSKFCPSNFSKVSPNNNQPITPGAVSNYYNLLNQYHSLLYNYYQLLDNGNTDSLIQAVNFVIQSDAQALRDDLINQSPFLSEAALRSAAMTGILTDALLLEICLANPEATMSEGFLEFVEFEIPNPLPESMVQLIYLNWDVETPRTILENQLSDITSELSVNYNTIMHNYHLNQNNPKDSIIKMLNNEGSIMSKLSVALTLAKNAEFANSRSLLNSLTNNNIPFWYEDDIENLKSYIDLLEAIQLQGKTFFELNEGEKTQLRLIRDLNTGRTSGYANNVMCFFYQECADLESSGTLERLSAKRRRVYNLNHPMGDELIKYSIDIRLTPNPVSDILNIEIIGYDENGNYELSIFDLNGSLIKNTNINSASSKINVDELRTGSYLYKVTLKDQSTINGKLFKL